MPRSSPISILVAISNSPSKGNTGPRFFTLILRDQYLKNIETTKRGSRVSAILPPDFQMFCDWMHAIHVASYIASALWLWWQFYCKLCMHAWDMISCMLHALSWLHCGGTSHTNHTPLPSLTGIWLLHPFTIACMFQLPKNCSFPKIGTSNI